MTLCRYQHCLPFSVCPCFLTFLPSPFFIFPSLLLKRLWGRAIKWCYLLFPYSNWIYWFQLILSLMCKERFCINGNTMWRKTNSSADNLLSVSFVVNRVSKDFLKFALHITLNSILLPREPNICTSFYFSFCSNIINYSLQKTTGSV